MSYTKTEWKTGDIITAEKMNKLEEGVSQLSETNGVTTEMSQSLWAIMQKTAFTSPLTDAELNAFKTAWEITGGGTVNPDVPDNPDEPDTPVNPEVTLTSISATYTGGNVPVGTSVNALTGITVKATYSDGSTKNVTGYTLSGTIAEGSNTITVSYGGKTTTFTVTGVAETESEVFSETNLLEGKTFHKTAFSGAEIDAGFKTNTWITDEDMTLEGGVTYYAYAPYEKAAYAVGAYIFSKNGDGTYTVNDTNSSHYYKNGNIDPWGKEKEDTQYFIDEEQTVQLNRYSFTPTETITARIGFNPNGYVGTNYSEYIYMFTKEYNPLKQTLVS